MKHGAGKLIEGIEALEQQREQRADIDDADPQEWRQQQYEGEKTGPAEEEIRNTRESATSFGGHRHHHAISISTRLSLAQMKRTVSPVANCSPPDGIAAVSRVPPAAMMMRVIAP